jgi:hypothetical protein
MRSHGFTAVFSATLALVLAGGALGSGSAQVRKGGAGMRAATNTVTIANQSLSLTVGCNRAGDIHARLVNAAAGWTVADGGCRYQAALASARGAQPAVSLKSATVSSSGASLVIRGKLAGLDLEQTYTAPEGRSYLEERIVLSNRTTKPIRLAALEIGLTRPIAASGGAVLPDCARDRWQAVPLLHRADDPGGFLNDFSASDLLTKQGYVSDPRYGPWMGRIPSPRRVSEGWAWVHGASVLGIYKFCQEHLQFSVLTPSRSEHGGVLEFGGAVMLEGEPADLGRILPGVAVDLGVTRYEAVRGGYTQASYAFRRMLDEKGARFPKSYNAPIHWEQLYNMEGAWDNRAERYTKAVVEKEAVRGREYSCEALYLDPGWDTEFGTFLWGEKWLGPAREFIHEMKSKYGLTVALHCPLATWATSPGMSMGPFAADSWPAAARRVDDSTGDEVRVPAVLQGHRNLALLPEAKASASSVFQNGKMAIHQIPHLADGWYGNGASWIADSLPAWAEVDLGGVHRISRVRLGNDSRMQYTDRAATALRILTATEYAADSAASTWRCVAELHGDPLTSTRAFDFAPVEARWVRVEITASDGGLPRLDEIEIYEADLAAQQQAADYERSARRGPKPEGGENKAVICLGSKQYIDEAAKRMLALCADGVAFLMFDGNWWNGGCASTRHGHPVPYRPEDHIRANLELARRIHAKFPGVYIEMHDMLAGGCPHRPTPVYYKYGLPGSYDDNWGFELMWDPMSDLKEGRAVALYYYNLGCNVPVYLHIDLRKDNPGLAVLWWYASTCRHLGIGGTNHDPAVVEAEKAAMRWYRARERFYKRGEFYGLGEEIHVHALPAENGCVLNVFNLSNEEKTVEGSVALKEIGLDPKRSHSCSSAWSRIENGTLRVRATLPPWTADVAEVKVEPH